MCYFSVQSVRAVKIYFTGSCPVNILIQTHDRPAFMALAETDAVFVKNIFLAKNWQP